MRLTQGRRAAGAGLALIAVAGCAVPPKGVTPEQLSVYEDAVASIGCDLLTERDYNTVQFQTGLSREQVLEVTKYQLAAGRAEKLENGATVLTVGICSDPSVRESTVIEQFRGGEVVG